MTTEYHDNFLKIATPLAIVKHKRTVYYIIDLFCSCSDQFDKYKLILHYFRKQKCRFCTDLDSV